MEKERDLPPFLNPKPKYYYYYEWMRRRIEARHPHLPAPVMDKLLTMDANELDLLLQYPAAIDGTVHALENVLESRGEEGLATWTVPLLSWEQKKELDEQQQLLLEQGSLLSGQNNTTQLKIQMDTDRVGETTTGVGPESTGGSSVKSISEEESGDVGEAGGDRLKLLD
jgi:hypothetical protein